jgi:hypothetical protein
VPELMSYIPDHWFRKHQKVDRDYLFGILFTKRKEFVQQVLMNANAHRMVTVQLDEEELNTKVCDEVAQMLSSIPYQPSKYKFLDIYLKQTLERKGKMLHLLKKKKDRKPRKKPAKVPVLGTLDQYHKQVEEASA